MLAFATLLVGSCGARSSLNSVEAPRSDAGIPTDRSSDVGAPDDVPPDAQGQAVDHGSASFDWDAQGGQRVEVGSCVFIEFFDPGWAVEGSYPDFGRSYEGPAQVTESGVNGLTLGLTDGTPVPSGAPPYIYVGGTPAPQLPRGADVWVSLKYEGQPQSEPCGPVATASGGCPVAVGWAFSVSDRREGTVLFGQTVEDPGEQLGFINPHTATPYCSVAVSCWVTSYYEVEVTGADSNPIPTGGSSTVSIAGVSYQFWAGAVSTTLPPDCGKEEHKKLVGITFKATDLAERAARLAPP